MSSYTRSRKTQRLGGLISLRRVQHDRDAKRLLSYFFAGPLAGVPWHIHDDLMFVDPRGYGVELNYMDLVVGRKKGRVLVCEREVEGRIVDQWLIHDEYNDEFKYLEEGERIIVRRAATHPSETNRA